MEEDLPKDVPGREAAEDLSRDAAMDSDLTAESQEDGRREKGFEENEDDDDDVHELSEGGGQMDLGVPEEEDLDGVLQELELTLKMTSVTEQEKIEGLTHPMEAETSSGSVRRRNKKRRAKKAAN